MNRARRLNPDDYGGMPSLLLHLHNKRRESTEISVRKARIGKNKTVSSRLAEVGKPLENSGEVKEIQAAVEEFVSNLLKNVGKLNSCFISTMIPSGSFYEGTKVTAPDEFDFMAEIQVLSLRGACVILWSSVYPGKPIIKIHPFLALNLFNELVDDADDSLCGCFAALGARRLRECFKETLMAALYMMDLPPCWRSVGIREEDKGPSILLGLTWNGRRYNNLEITIDITPAIKFHHWPLWTDFSSSTASGATLESCVVMKNLPSRSLMYEVCRIGTAEHYPPSGPPVNYALKKGEAPSLQPLLLPLPLEEIGFHVVPTSPLWRTSFSVPELHILKKFSPDSNRLTCYRCAKYFRDQHLGDNTVLTSYLLKTTFLFELEKFPEDKFWHRYEMFARLYGMMFRLLRESKEDMVCSYFISNCYITNTEMETILPHAVQRVLDDLLLLASPKPIAQCCHSDSNYVGFKRGSHASDDDDADHKNNDNFLGGGGYDDDDGSGGGGIRSDGDDDHADSDRDATASTSTVADDSSGDNDFDGDCYDYENDHKSRIMMVMRTILKFKQEQNSE